jgi:hypothetical protein
MRVEVQFTDACPNAALVIDRLNALSTAHDDLHVVVRLVEVDEPVPDGFSGSPTVLINGNNPFAGAPTVAAACALRPPTPEQVEAAVLAQRSSNVDFQAPN